MAGLKQIIKPPFLDDTAKEMLIAMQKQANALNSIAATQYVQSTNMATWQDLALLMEQGIEIARKVMPVGTVILHDWTDVGDNNKVYTDVESVILDYKMLTTPTGKIKPAAMVGWRHTLPFNIQFDNYEAFYAAENELPAGTYNVVLDYTWTKAIAGTYQFTLTKPVPAGGQLTGFKNAADVGCTATTVISYASAESTEKIEEVAITEGTDGTCLGHFTAAGTAELNSFQRAAYGYNRWSQSALRQYLNSDGAVNTWWKPQNKYDRPPDIVTSKAGFLSGCSEEFKACIQPVNITTALNTVTDSADGTSEVTEDKIFLLSLQEINITPQLADVEGDTTEYWAESLGVNGYAKPYPPNYYDAYKVGAINAKTTAQYAFTRSANRGNAFSVWYLNPSGCVSNSYARYALRALPACYITSNPTNLPLAPERQ